MSEMTCSTFGDVASELALDLLDGEARARAVAHLETCAACRQEVASLTEAAHEVLMLAPPVEPSPGFERAVLARIAPARDQLGVATDRSGRRRWSRPRRVLTVAAALLLIVGGAVAVAARTHDHHTALRTAEMRTSAQQVVGQVEVTADPAVVKLDIPDWIALVRSYGATVDAPYWIAVTDAHGARTLYRLPPADAQPWHVATALDGADVRSISVVDNHGTVWCTARLT